MTASGSAGSYQRRKGKKRRGQKSSVLRPIGPTLRPIVQPGITPTPGLSGPGTTRPGAPKPAAPKPKAPVQPLDPELENQKIIGQRDVALSDLYSTWQQANLDTEYGFGAGGAASPYNRAALLQENYKRGVLGTTSAYGSAGQINSGSYGAAQNENARNYDIGYDQLRRSYDQASGNIAFNRLQTYANAGGGIDQAKFQALLDAMRGL